MTSYQVKILTWEKEVKAMKGLFHCEWCGLGFRRRREVYWHLFVGCPNQPDTGGTLLK